MEERQRTASCGCGNLTFTVAGEPMMTSIFHCTACQKRTGTSHQISAWFRDEQIRSRSGGFKEPERTTKLGGVRNEFCADCGTTVSWTNAKMPGLRGVPVLWPQSQ
jgi:hypothetical protein